MTPKEKAKQLLEESNWSGCDIDGKLLVLTCLDEVINLATKKGVREPIMYWSKVKEEIIKL